MSGLKSLVPRSIKNVARNAEWWYRYRSRAERALPDFILIGAQKSGTTSLYAYLAQHPQIMAPFEKEVHFFDGGLHQEKDNFALGEGWYRANFPLRNDVQVGQKVFEASPSYIFNPLAPSRIASLLPNVKLIVLLRNPTQRAISHYFHERRIGAENLTIEDALNAEEDRLAPVLLKKQYRDPHFVHHSYKLRGRYKEQLARYYKHFDSSQLLVFSGEYFFAEPAGVLREIFHFLEVDETFEVADLRPRYAARDKTEVTSEVYDRLDSYFEPHNQALYKFVGENYGW